MFAPLTLLNLVSGSLAFGVVYFCVKLYQKRSRIRGLPGPPHHWLFGSIPVLYNIASRLPEDVHAHTYAYYLQKEYDLPNIFYIDLWPIGPSWCVLLDPEMAAQVTQRYALPKYRNMQKYLEPMIDAENMVSSSGEMWKKLRSMFSPGFSLSHMMTLVPGIIDNTLTFAERLGVLAAEGKTFSMEEETTKVTVDVIGKVMLDTDLNCQRSDNELLSAFRSQAESLPGNSVLAMLKAWEPRRLLLQRKNTRIINNYIRNIILKRFEHGSSTERKQKYVIDLALDTYVKQSGLEKSEKSEPSTNPTLDSVFIDHAVTQMKTFLFAGHDTTSSTITYVYHLLSLNPECLRLVREEHNQAFAALSLAETAMALKTNPSLLNSNSLPYTLAVIRETLRLYPAASAVRSGSLDVPITDQETGQVYPTGGFMVWVVHYAMHRRADLFPHPLEFRPERFMPEPPAPFSKPMPRNAWRPFEKGPRNCIGQELATLEIKIIMALTIRFFDFEADYQGPGRDATPWGSKVRQGTRGAKMAEKSRDGLFVEAGWNQVDGERAYQIMMGSAKPKDGFPCRVWKVGEKPVST